MADLDGLDRCGVGIRGVAMGIDTVVWFGFFLLATTAVGALTGQLERTADGLNADLTGGPALAAMLVWLALGIGYHTLLEWRYGQTIGKRLVAIRVLGEDGESLSLRASAIRNALRLVDWLPLFYLLGILAILISDKQRRLGDRVGNTTVVR